MDIQKSEQRPAGAMLGGKRCGVTTHCSERIIVGTNDIMGLVVVVNFGGETGSTTDAQIRNKTPGVVTGIAPLFDVAQTGGSIDEGPFLHVKYIVAAARFDDLPYASFGIQVWVDNMINRVIWRQFMAKLDDDQSSLILNITVVHNADVAFLALVVDDGPSRIFGYLGND
ncbi:hypothetical protein BDR04DRAFT_1144227 [Suillus decipiens]|nr:hypothetical protein BDR04DRAFT_1144227 [Suillus decipiens]